MRHMRRLVSRPGQIVFYLTTAITKIFIALIIEITFLIFQKYKKKSDSGKSLFFLKEEWKILKTIRYRVPVKIEETVLNVYM